MNILITAGNTLALIDQVRCLTNIFTGRTGAAIAGHAHQRGHTVTLLTSNPEAIKDVLGFDTQLTKGFYVRSYRTFEDLQARMAELISPALGGSIDAVIHSAAVSDYLAQGVYAPAPQTQFQPEDGSWRSSAAGGPTLVDRQARKIKSDESELWIRLVRAPKLVDLIRYPWGFSGVLVKFKLEVGLSDEDLLRVAERSRIHSQADLMVANTLENAAYYAYLGPVDGGYKRLVRRHLPEQLLDAIEQLHAQRGTLADTGLGHG